MKDAKMLPYIGLDIIKIPKVVVFKSCICLLPAGSWRSWKTRGFLSFLFFPLLSLLCSPSLIWCSGLLALQLNVQSITLRAEKGNGVTPAPKELS